MADQIEQDTSGEQQPSADDRDAAYHRARTRAEKKLGFYVHAAAYVVANAIMIAVNLVNTPGNLWFYWPLAGWGLGLFLHGVSVFSETAGAGLKERMIERELERERRRHGGAGDA